MRINSPLVRGQTVKRFCPLRPVRGDDSDLSTQTKPSISLAKIWLGYAWQNYVQNEQNNKNPHRRCVILWGLVFLLFLSRYGDCGKVSQLTLRMVLKALRCLKPSGGDVLARLFVCTDRLNTFRNIVSSPPVYIALLSRFVGNALLVP